MESVKLVSEETFTAIKTWWKFMFFTHTKECCGSRKNYAAIKTII